MKMQGEHSTDVHTILLRELPTGVIGILTREVVHIWKVGLLLPTGLFAVNAVRGVGRAQPAVVVCALNL
jgi:hypothetical protein